MADQNGNNVSTLTFKVDVGDAKNNLKAYKDYVDGLKGSLLQLEKGTDKYNEVAAELKSAQEKLNEVMDVAKGKGESVAGSYDALTKEMSELKKQFKATGDEAERTQLALRINEVNDQLKNLDASVGVYSRNVGNYQRAFEGAFTSLKNGISSSIPGVNKLNSSFKALAANPVGAVITAIAVAIAAVTKAMKSSESQMNQFKVATAGIRVVVDGLKNALTSVSQAVVNLIEKVSNLGIGLLTRLKDGFRSLGGDKWADGMETFLEKIETYQDLEKKEIDLEQRRRDLAVESARVQNQVNELRAKIAEKDKYSVEERLKYVEQWEKAEKRLAQISVELAQAEYDAIKKKNEQTENSTKDYDAENDALVRLIQAQGQFNESLRSINKTRAQLLSQVTGEEFVERVADSLEPITSSLQTVAQTQSDTLDAMTQKANKYIQDRMKQNRKLKEDEAAALEERKNNIMSFAGSVGSILSSVAGAWMDSVRAQVNAGKMSEEEGERQFEQIKALQTAEAIINTIAGAVGAFMGITKDTGGWGIVAAAAQAAAVMAAGMAQVSRIQSTTLGAKSNGGGDINVPDLGGIVNEYNPTYTQNLTNVTETENLANALRKNPIKAYVVESEVTNAQQLANERYEQTSF